MKPPPRRRARALLSWWRRALCVALACLAAGGASAAPGSREPSRPPKKAAASEKPVRAARAVREPAPDDKAAPADPPVYTEADCVALACRQNPEVIGAAKRIDAARAVVLTAKAPLYPAVTGNAYYQRRDQSIANGGSVTTTTNGAGQIVVRETNTNRPNDYYGDVRGTQNLFSGFAVRNRIAAAKLQADVAGSDYETQLDTTTLAVRLAFYQTLYAQESISVRQQAVDLLAAQVKDQQDKLAIGTVGQINVNRTQVALANERPALLDARAAVGTANAALAQVLGVSYAQGSLAAPFRVRGALEVRPMPMTLGECLERALAKRPEMQARQTTIEALRRQVKVERSGTLPQVSAFASYDVYSEPDIRTTNDTYSGYTLGITGNWALFDGFATRGRVRTAQAQVGEAEAQLAATRKQVENDVYTAYSDLHTAESSLAPLAENSRLASDTLDLTTRNFDAGLINQLDVLQSRVDLTRTRLTELAGRLAYLNALARLERAMALGRPTQGTATGLQPK